MNPEDERYMRQALALARRGAGRTSPNPAVGAVLVGGGQVVGTGWHHRAGEPHAEVLALRQAGEAARGATLYVTLEPCTHHGRTPPCAPVVIAAGVARVVIAMTDPDPRVGGKGVAALRQAGLQVDVGPGAADAAHLNEAYVLHRREGRPFVTYKAAISADGGTAAADRTSKWITGPAARMDAHRLRASSDAICVGVMTVLADNPSLTVRGVALLRPAPPLRVVLDTHARTPPEAAVLAGDAPTLVAVSEAAPRENVAELIDAGAEVALLPTVRGEVSIPALLGVLAERDVLSLLVEGGARVAGSFVSERLVDRFRLYVAPMLLGEDGLPLVTGWHVSSIDDALRLHLESVRRFGEDLRIDLVPREA